MAARTFTKRILAAAFAVAASVACASSLTGCSQVQDALGIVSNTNPAVQLESVLPAGSTIDDGVLTVGINASKSAACRDPTEGPLAPETLCPLSKAVRLTPRTRHAHHASRHDLRGSF